MLPTDQLVAKATTLVSNLQAMVPQIWAAQIERNLRNQAVLQQSVLENTDLTVPGAGDKVFIPSLPDLTALVPLTEGTDMTVIALNNATSVALTPSEFGLMVEISRKALDRIGYDGIAETMDRLAYAVTLRVEGDIANLFGAVVPGTATSMTVMRPNGKTSATIAAADTLNDSLMLDAYAALKVSNNIGPFILYISPVQFAALVKDSNIRQDLRFAEPASLLNGEVGQLHGIRLIVTNFLKTTVENTVTTTNAMMVCPRWAVIAWKRRPELVVDPTLYDGGRRRRFGAIADYDVELLHAERGMVLRTA